VTLKGLKEEFQTPDKYQVQVSAKANELIIIDSGFKDITAETFRCVNNYAKRDEVVQRLSPSGSLVLDVNVIVKLQKVSPTRSIVHNSGDYRKQI
jgi:hypothetical protein